MRVRKIYGIKGGCDPGYEPMAAFNGARAGFIWCADIGGIIERDDQPIDLIVEGYPEPRSFEKPEQRAVKVRMIRRGASIPLTEFYVNLLNLVEKPSLAAGEWNEMITPSVKRLIRYRSTCSDYAHHEHRFRWTAALCGKAQHLWRFISGRFW